MKHIYIINADQCRLPKMLTLIEVEVGTDLGDPTSRSCEVADLEQILLLRFKGEIQSRAGVNKSNRLK